MFLLVVGLNLTNTVSKYKFYLPLKRGLVGYLAKTNIEHSQAVAPFIWENSDMYMWRNKTVKLLSKLNEGEIIVIVLDLD